MLVPSDSVYIYRSAYNWWDFQCRLSGKLDDFQLFLLWHLQGPENVYIICSIGICLEMPYTHILSRRPQVGFTSNLVSWMYPTPQTNWCSFKWIRHGLVDWVQKTCIQYVVLGYVLKCHTPILVRRQWLQRYRHQLTLGGWQLKGGWNAWRSRSCWCIRLSFLCSLGEQVEALLKLGLVLEVRELSFLVQLCPGLYQLVTGRLHEWE